MSIIKSKETIVATNKNLKELIGTEIEKYGNDADLNHIDVSKVTNMLYMFRWTQFNGDISKWDVSNVTNMHSMFLTSKFNGDISKWDVSNVTNMQSMFEDSKFNGDISKWNVSKITNMEDMFLGSIIEKQNLIPEWWSTSNDYIEEEETEFIIGEQLGGRFVFGKIHDDTLTELGFVFDSKGKITLESIENIDDQHLLFELSSFDGYIVDKVGFANPYGVEKEDMLETVEINDDSIDPDKVEVIPSTHQSYLTLEPGFYIQYTRLGKYATNGNIPVSPINFDVNKLSMDVLTLKFPVETPMHDELSFELLSGLSYNEEVLDDFWDNFDTNRESEVYAALIESKKDEDGGTYWDVLWKFDKEYERM